MISRIKPVPFGTGTGQALENFSNHRHFNEIKEISVKDNKGPLLERTAISQPAIDDDVRILVFMSSEGYTENGMDIK